MKIKILNNPSEKQKSMIQMYLIGISHAEIGKEFKISEDTARRTISRYLVFEREKDITQLHFGVKTEAYATEEELLRGYVAPNIKDLVAEEKMIAESEIRKEWKLKRY